MENEPSNQTAPSTPPTHPSRQSNRKIIIGLAAAVIVIFALILWHGGSHSTEKPAAAYVVGVVKATREDLFNAVSIPAEFRPYVEVELHAKVTGYVDKMNVDFGDKVKTGQLLATLEVPELQDQLHNAVALQQRADADYTNAHLMYTRLFSVNQEHSNLVAQQDIDTAQSKETTAAAAIAAAKADVERYQTLVKYTQITAPFDGVITKRYADPGTLIQSGTSGEGQTLLRISDNYRLRLDFPVSVEYVKDIRIGDSVEVRVDSLGGKKFTGKIARSSQKVNEETRTMTVEVEVDNPDLEMVPGMYAAVELKVQSRLQTLAIPVGAVSGERNPTVYVIDDKSEIESRPVTLGIETADKYEIISGLKEGEMVMIGNRSFVHPGQKVETKLIVSQATP
jgi:RND family efflux transporter MFP subunit